MCVCVCRDAMKCCPRCGSGNLKYMPWLGEIYECKDCGFRGSFVVEDGDLMKLVMAEREQSEQSEQEETLGDDAEKKRKR